MFARLAVFFTIFIIAAGIYFVVPWTVHPLPSTSSSPNRSVTAQPSDPDASPLVRETMRRLADYSQSVDKILSGQNIGHTASDLFRSHYRTWTRLIHFRDQPAPAIMAIDLGLNQIPTNASPLLKLAKPHAEAGGLISISMHPSNPWTDGSYNDREHGRFEDLLQSDAPAHQRWKRTLDHVARVLKELQQNDITVLWRPLHEPNGNWFWWSGGGANPPLSSEQYKQLWKQMRHHFQVEHGLHNLIWVYSANVKTGSEVLPPMSFYPGDDVVDVVGLDYYGPSITELNAAGCYDEILKSGKIVALTEFGSKPMDGSLDTIGWSTAMHTRYPHFAYFVFWHSWPGKLVSLPDLDKVEPLLGADWVHHLK